jgi:hypothetical protein
MISLLLPSPANHLLCWRFLSFGEKEFSSELHNSFKLSLFFAIAFKPQAKPVILQTLYLALTHPGTVGATLKSDK